MLGAWVGWDIDLMNIKVSFIISLRSSQKMLIFVVILLISFKSINEKIVKELIFFIEAFPETFNFSSPSKSLHL